MQVLSLDGAPQQVLTMPGANSLVGLCTLNVKGRRVFVLDHFARTIHTLLRSEETRREQAQTAEKRQVVEGAKAVEPEDPPLVSGSPPPNSAVPEPAKTPLPAACRLRGGETMPIPPHTAVVVSGILKKPPCTKPNRPSAAPMRSASTGRPRKLLASRGPSARPSSGRAHIRANQFMDRRVVEILLG